MIADKAECTLYRGPGGVVGGALLQPKGRRWPQAHSRVDCLEASLPLFSMWRRHDTLHTRYMWYTRLYYNIVRRHKSEIYT